MTDFSGEVRWAMDWVSHLSTPPMPQPSGWADVDWCNYWREQRHRVVEVLVEALREHEPNASSGRTVYQRVTQTEGA